MASKVASGRQPGQMQQRTGRSPRRAASPRREPEPSLEREQALQKQLNELQKYKEQEEKDKKKEEALKKKELTAAKKRITKEVQSSMKIVKKHEQEVVKLQTTIRKMQGQESDVKKKSAETENKFKEKLHLTEVKHQDLETKLSQKFADAAQERVKLQQLQLQLDTLANNNIDLSKYTLGSLGALGDAGDNGRALPSLHDSAVETTDAEGEERFAQAESEVSRLAQQLGDMRIHYEEAEEQRRVLLERLAEMERGEAGANAEDLHRESREAIEGLRQELDRLREENEGLHAKLGAANKALELQEECIEELAGRATGVGEGLMNIASQELARCSVIQSDSRLLSSNCSRRGSTDGNEADASSSRRGATEEEIINVGDIVRLSPDSMLVREAFRNVGFAWNEQTDAMLGKAYPVLEVPKQGIIGLPSPDGSQGGVWYFPMMALQKVSTSQPPSPGSASATASTTATRDLYQRATFPKGPHHDLGLSANSMARSSTPGRYAGFQGGGSGRANVSMSGSAGSVGPTAYHPSLQTPASPPSFAGVPSNAAPEARGEEEPVLTTPGLDGLNASVASSTVYVGSIPYTVSDDQITAEFAKYGVIIEMQVQRDDSGPQKSYALLSYSSVEEATRAVKATSGGKLIFPDGAVPCEVGFARSAQVGAMQGLSQTSAPIETAVQTAQVVIHGIPNETPEDVLMGEFQKYGNIISFQLYRDPATGPQKSYALVSYSTVEDANRAVKATAGGRFYLPGATTPSEVIFARSAQVGVVQGTAQLAARTAPVPQVIVRPIPNETADDALMGEFQKYGGVANFQMHRDPAGPERSYAVITYVSLDDATRAAEATNQRLVLPGAMAPVEVGFANVAAANPVPTAVRQQQQPIGVVGGQQVIIYSIPNETPDDLLKAEFTNFGTVVDFTIQRDSNRPVRSYAVVTYLTREEAARAIEVTNGRLVMPGATSPAQVGYPPASHQPAQGQTAAWLKQMQTGHQVVVTSIPEATSRDALKAEFAKFGVVVDVQIQMDPTGQQRTYAFVTYQAAEDAARAVEAASTVGGLLLPGASSPCEVGFAARSTLSPVGQVLTPGQLMSLKQQQVRPQSAPRLRSAGPAVGRQASSGSGGPPPDGVEAEAGGCAWASLDPRRYLGQWHTRLDTSVRELDATYGRYFGQAPPYDLSASAGALHSARPMARQWPVPMPSEPVALPPGGAEVRQLSPPCVRLGAAPRAGAVGIAHIGAPPGSHVAAASTAAHYSEQHLLHMQANRVLSYRSPAPSRPGTASPSPGVLMVPTPAPGWRGVPSVPMSARPAARQAVTPGPLSAHGSYVPPVAARPAMSGTQSPSTAAPVVTQQVVSPLSTAVGVVPVGTVGPVEQQDLSTSVGPRTGFREAVAKVTAKALREYRQNHRVSLQME